MIKQKIVILCGVLFLFCSSSFAGITVDRDSVYVDVTEEYLFYGSNCTTPQYELFVAWTTVSEPTGYVDSVKARTNCHFKIFNSTGDSLLWNSRVNDVLIGSGTLTMAFPVNTILTSSHFIFDVTTSDFINTVSYPVTGAPTDVRLYADNTYKIQITGQSRGCGSFAGKLGEKVLYTASITIPCCIGIAGNVDADIDDIVDISDFVYLNDFMFTDGPAPICLAESDFDYDQIIDISDLVYFVDFMFTDGPPPPNCP